MDTPKNISFGMVGDRPTPGNPRRNPEALRLSIAELAVALGLAKVFSNHQDIVRLLEAIQNRLLHLSLDNQGGSSLSPADSDGLIRSRDFFVTQFSATIPTASIQNRAGGMLVAAKLKCDQARHQLQTHPEIKTLQPELDNFLNQLSSLLGTLEGYEYHLSNITN